VREVGQQRAHELPLDAAVFAEQKKLEELEAGAARWLEEGEGGDDADEGGDGWVLPEFFREKNIMETGFEDHSYLTYVHRMVAEAGGKFNEDVAGIDKAHDNFWHRLQTKWDLVANGVCVCVCVCARARACVCRCGVYACACVVCECICCVVSCYAVCACAHPYDSV
jgi:hypothetical protein